MSSEIEAAKEIVSHPATVGGAVVAVFGWMARALWRGHRHEIANMKQVSTNLDAAVKGKADQAQLDAAWREIDERKKVEAKIFDFLREHDKDDRDRDARREEASRNRHDELISIIGDIRADIAGLKK